MARKPNYQFERQERQRQKAAKKAAKKEKAALNIDEDAVLEPAEEGQIDTATDPAS